MTSRLFNYLKSDLIVINYQQLRHGHKMRGKRPGIAKNLQQRLEEMNRKDPEIDFKVDIGFQPSKLSRSALSTGYMEYVKQVRKNPEMERKARRKELLLDLEGVKKDWWSTSAPQQIKTISDHYGVYDDLFGDAYFYPVLPMEIKYEYNSSEIIPVVHRGNLIKSSETQQPPKINYEAAPDSLWTLLLTTPDANFTSRELEYCHWFIGNIPGNDIDKGDLLIDYMRPIPPMGMGLCRYIFVLYKQDKKIDFAEYKKEQPCLALEKRNWKTLDFYRKYQDIITPASIAFFQAEWDQSLKDFYHNTLQMKSPKFEYDFPPPYIRPQEWFPLKQAFNLYLDRYRDPKDINKDFLLKKLKKTHPFKGPERPLKYPRAYAFDRDMPSWLKTELVKEQLKQGRINDIE
ncbi:39S ribosomal protein L38, mitochondrial [Microplitis mediator]|uniref:39S ribosomal protein L38, mitochondrial n=1 Tax=Microplitis mediator TaxID=375433 RepID=UPI00255350F9|nr:39S ribosomal protein L38, mitochondrial [Microplitis mediator]